MNETLKYIITEIYGLDTPILFPPWVVHKDVANGVGGSIVSAGHCKIFAGEDGLEVEAFGKSETLDIKSRKEVDAGIIKTVIERLSNGY